MNRIDFTQPGGFPLTQDTLSFMQESYDFSMRALSRSFGSLMSHFGYNKDHPYLILSGCELDIKTGLIHNGIVSVHGEIMKFTGGTLGHYVEVIGIGKAVTFEDGIEKEVYNTHSARITNTKSEILFAEFLRIYKYDEHFKSVVNNALGNVRSFGCTLDGVLYVGAYGIWRQDSSGQLVQTNKQDEIFGCMGNGPDGTLYFGSNRIWRLNPDGQIVQIVQDYGPSEVIVCMINGFDGTLYFVSNGGLRRLNADNQVQKILSFTFLCAGKDVDGNLYFGSNNGVYRMGRNGQNGWLPGVQGECSCMGLAPDGRLYFGTWDTTTPIFRLEPDGSITECQHLEHRYYCCGNAADGTLYFGSREKGIFYINPNGDQIQTNVKDGPFYCCGNAADGTLYFGGSKGIYRLIENNQIIQVMAASEVQSMILTPKGDLYFGSNGVVYNIKPF